MGGASQVNSSDLESKEADLEKIKSLQDALYEQKVICTNLSKQVINLSETLSETNELLLLAERKVQSLEKSGLEMKTLEEMKKQNEELQSMLKLTQEENVAQTKVTKSMQDQMIAAT